MLQFFVQYDTIIKVSVGYSLANAFCSEEQNQAQAKLVFDFARTYNEKIIECEARLPARPAGFLSVMGNFIPITQETLRWDAHCGVQCRRRKRPPQAREIQKHVSATDAKQQGFRVGKRNKIPDTAHAYEVKKQ